MKNFEIQNLIQEKIEKERQLSAFQKADQQKQEQYEHKITELNSLKKQLDDDRIRLQDEREENVRIQFEKMRETWKNHEKKVEESIRGICSRHQIEYIDKEQLPFRGKPDNTLKLSMNTSSLMQRVRFQTSLRISLHISKHKPNS